MAEREHIGALAVHFTAGVAAGTLLVRFHLPPYPLAAGLLPVMGTLLAVILRKGRSDLLFPVFLLCGAFAALNGSFTGPDEGIALRVCGPAEKLRGLIDGIPFPTGSTAPLLKAFLTGDRSGLSRDTVRIFRESGASHLLALSGLHIGILYMLLSRLLWPIGNSPAAKGVRYAVTLLAAGGFTLMTGASPSIVRAFLFILLNETARLTGRPRQPVRVLSTALLIQLVLSPQSIASTGFQLSYLAMTGIFLVYPHLEAWYPEGPRFDPVRKIWQAAALSISCQLFTGPLAWLRFGSFPVYFLITNLLAMPLTTLLMATGTATVALQGMGWCPPILTEVTDRLCSLLLFVLETIASL